ncbi:hypothetical protein HPB47_014324, partial [Ixodes persulcatus]
KKYLVNFEVYRGTVPTANRGHKKDFWKAATRMLQMINELQAEIRPLPFSFQFDKVFTGMNLLSHLKQQGYGGSGTMQ